MDVEFTEFKQIENAVVAMQDESGGLSIRDHLMLFMNARVFKPLLLSLALMFLQQASGINAVIFYTSQIFANAGFSSDPNTPTMIVGAVLVVATLVSCIVADIAGRRKLLLMSGAAMTASIATLGVYFYVTEQHQVCLSLCLSVCLSVSVRLCMSVCLALCNS